MTDNQLENSAWFSLLIAVLVAVLVTFVFVKQITGTEGRWYPILKTVKADNTGHILEMDRYFMEDRK